MDFVTAIKTCFRKYATFEGRAARSEFWYWFLFGLLGGIVTGFVDGFLFDAAGLFYGVFSLVILLPNLAVAARRLHDIGKSGWWQLLTLVPLIGIVVLIVWWVRAGQTGGNRFGDDPLGVADAAFLGA